VDILSAGPTQQQVDAPFLAHLPAACAELRPYQREQLERAADAVRRGVRRILLQAPTGSGKTHLIAALSKAVTDAELRIVVLAPRTRLVQQIHERLLAFKVPHGVIAAALSRLRFNNAPAQVCAIDTLVRRCIADERMPLPGADVVVFDECHLALGRTRVELLERYPEALHIGFTATPAKVSGRPLADRFDELILGPSTRELIDAGHLVRPRVFSTPVVLARELEHISKDSKTGDYATGELAALMSRPRLVGDVLGNWLNIANGKRTLIFACDKGHGASLLEQFFQAGVVAEMVTDQTAEAEREEAIARLESGQTTVLINCFLLSYGVDLPAVECIVLARPTRSLTLYLQAVGRGLRPFPGKDQCIVIDHGRVVETLGMPHADFPWSLAQNTNINQLARSNYRGEGTEKPRTCPECHHAWLVSEEGPACTACGWAPAPIARPIDTLEADLREVGAIDEEQMTAFSPQVQRFYCEALGDYINRKPEVWRTDPRKARAASWFATKEKFELRTPQWAPRLDHTRPWRLFLPAVRPPATCTTVASGTPGGGQHDARSRHPRCHRSSLAHGAGAARCTGIGAAPEEGNRLPGLRRARSLHVR
jgi:superfamily II DNA or RNA helicase